MTEYKCGNCSEVQILSPKARFCAYCGSSSLNLIIKELTEPAQKISLGVIKPAPTVAEVLGPEADSIVKEEEDQPRRRRR